MKLEYANTAEKDDPLTYSNNKFGTIEEVREEESTVSARNTKKRGGALCQYLGTPNLIENEETEILDT